MPVLMLQHVSSRVPGFPVASPCLWGKLQNLSCVKVSWFCVTDLAIRDILTCMCLQTCRNSLCVASAILSRRFHRRWGEFSWQAWHFGDLHRQFAWQGQHSRRVVLVRIAMSGLHEAVTTCNSVAGLRCYDMWWRSALHTLHSTLYTLHSTLHSAFHTPHFTLHTLHFTPKLYILYFTLYMWHFTLHTLHSTRDTPHLTLRTPNSTLYTPHFTLHTLYTPHFSLCTPHSTLYTRHSTLYTPNFAPHPLPHSTVYSTLVQ